MMKMKQILLCATLVASLLGAAAVQAEGVTMNSSAFSDVPSNHWAYETIEWGYTNKVASGYEDGTFKPSNSVTEEEFLALLVRSFKGEDFSANGGKWSDPYYEIAKANNYPVSNTRDSKITRASVAEIIVGTQGKNYSGNDAIQYMLGKGLANGKTSGTIGGYAGKDTLTRAEAIQFIRNVLSNVSSKELLPRPTTPSPKEELPNLPIPDDYIVGGKDDKLAIQASDVQNAVSDMGYNVGYNSEHKSIFVTDSQKRIFMSYTDSRYMGEDYTIVINTAGLLDAKEKVDQNKINAITAALKALGLPVTSELGKTMTKVLAPGVDEGSVTFGDITIDMSDNGYGRIVMYVD